MNAIVLKAGYTSTPSAHQQDQQPIRTDPLSYGGIDTAFQEKAHTLEQGILEIVRSAAQEENSTHYHAQLEDLSNKILQAQQQGDLPVQQETATVDLDIPDQITGWDEVMIRRLVDTVRIVDENNIIVIFKEGTEVERSL